MSCENCPLKGEPRVGYKKGTLPIAIIGEGPGEEEAQQKIPFVGPSGKFLNQTLAQAGLERKDVYLLNSMQCKKTKKHTKKDLETAIKCCKEYVLKALDQIKPKVIVLLGEYALLQLLNKTKISKVRGQIFFHNQAFVIPTFHPAACLRQGLEGNYASSFRLDILTAVKLLKTDQTIEYSSLYLPEGNLISVDVETENLYIHTNPVLLSIALSNGKQTFATADKIPTKVKNLLEDPKIIKVMCNRAFDQTVLTKLGINLQGKILDIMTLAHEIDENLSSYSLENLARQYTNLVNIKSLAQGKREGQLGELSKDTLLTYNSADALATAQIARVLIPKLKRDPKLEQHYKHYILPVEDCFAEAFQNGWIVDTDLLSKTEKELAAQIAQLERELLSEVPKSIRESHDNKLVPNLVSEFLFSKKGLKLKPQKFTEKTQVPSTDIYHLKIFSEIPWVNKLLYCKKLQKVLNTFLRNIRQHLHPDGKLYPSILLCGTVTGRTVILNPAMQQFPARGELSTLIRKHILPPPGYVVCGMDVSQSELRIIAWLAQEKTMLEALNNGIDLHTKTASIISGLPLDQITKDLRQKSKSINFGLIYGMSAPSLVKYTDQQYDIKITLEEATLYREKFFQAYPNLLKYYNYCIKMARKNKAIRGVLGKIRHLPEIDSSDIYIAGKAERQAINFPVQNFSSELACLGVMLFREALKQSHLKDKVLLTTLFIHDAYYYQAREDIAEEAQKLFAECMCYRTKEYIRKIWGIDVAYPIEIETKISPYL